ncbi:MAG TPA: T9SS type A sorting domain-containing protein [Chitinophagales bacterium]|nr:T9SS type A sorting domain-containing protein [Chitinophagales bacterium]
MSLANSQAQDTWSKKANLGGEGDEREGAIGFSIGNKGYLGTGVDNSDPIYKKDFWEYDPANDVWTQKADFGGGYRAFATGFSIGSKGFIGLGQMIDSTSHTYTDFWEYNPDSNTWTQKADFAGGERFGAVGFSICGKGYIGTGGSNDFWEYDPSTEIWTKKADFGGTHRYNAVGFSIGSKGYIGTGFLAFPTNGLAKDFWEYDPLTNTWTQKSDFGGTARTQSTGFAIDAKGYIGTGIDVSGNEKNDFWEYDPITDIWKQKADFGGPVRYWATGFSIGSRGYIGTGSGFGLFYNDFWEYTPVADTCPSPVNLSVTDITGTSVTLNWEPGAFSEGYKLRYKISTSGHWNHAQASGPLKTIYGLSPETKYTWQIKSFCDTDPFVFSDWSAKQKFVTGALRISDELISQAFFQIYPNPATDYATVQFTLVQPSHVSIKVYDVSGREMETLLSGNMDPGNLPGTEISAGTHTLQLNITHFSKGIYFVKMITDAGVLNQKLIVH